MASQALLAGVRVVDLSQYIPGPFATRQLADLGADVIKIEPPGGDPMRRFMAAADDGPSPIYRHLNRGKRVCRLDLKRDEDREVLAALLREADILLESFRPGVLARLGFDRERLEAINPRLIHCALSGFGQTGPYAQRAGHDINYCALAGQSLVSGSAERPVIGFPPIADHASALQAAIGMLAALHGRENRDRGIFLDISITESMLAWQYLPLLGDATERAASILNGGAACYNIYRCADGRFVSLGAIEEHFWKNFCTALQRPAWIPRQFEAMPQAALIAEVGEHIGEFASDHWHRLLDAVDCCYAPLLTAADLPAMPHFHELGSVTPSGPAYPGRIDGDAVKVDETLSEFEAGRSPAWRPAE
jgi:crotonobetainyl-CoA:carnitine CoA-transferase CaiB-like acyl-CoA transferase